MVIKPPFKRVGPKGVFIILDGLGDRSIPELDGKTPLEAAHTPNMNELAKRGMCGLVSHLSPWTPVGTQIGCGLLMGLAADDVDSMRRGPIEALGAGLDLKENDLAFRGNFATLKPDGSGIIDRRSGRVSVNNHELAQALDGLEIDGVICRFKSATQHRLVVTLSGPNLSEAITDTDPGASLCHKGVKVCRPMDNTDPDGQRTARVVNKLMERCREILAGHPLNKERVARGFPIANGILLRGPGVLRQPRNLIRRLAIKAGLVTGEGTLIGLAQLFGFTTVYEQAFTADEHTNLEGKMAAVLNLLEDHDIAYLHIKATDLFSHDRDPVGKQQFLEKLDPILEPLLDPNLVVAISADHSTDSNTGRHSGDPVPSLLSGPQCRRDPVESFGEFPCISGGLGQLTSTQFLCAFLDYMGQLRNYRPGDRAYY